MNIKIHSVEEKCEKFLNNFYSSCYDNNILDIDIETCKEEPGAGNSYGGINLRSCFMCCCNAIRYLHGVFSAWRNKVLRIVVPLNYVWGINFYEMVYTAQITILQWFPIGKNIIPQSSKLVMKKIVTCADCFWQQALQFWKSLSYAMALKL